ncbi:MAG: peptidase M16 [Candidatus Riflebacteria bacterium HGW-Riflebacteria-2]|jgi:predicted Zn-dependent peptidase|nr:MAG: peptidase M16 [Candidatus Riflebacteria bacterium HGW-Riflebacteria-2]
MRQLKATFTVFLTLIILLHHLAASAGTDFDFSALEKSIFEYSLDNGLKIIVLPRHDAPVVSLVTWVDVGGADDPKEYSGLAHMLEHMAFKGTATIGSRDPENEAKLMADEDRIFERLRLERLKGRLADPEKIKNLTEQMNKAIENAYAVIEPNAFSNILQSEGGSGLNAFTSRDQTAYIISMPSNKLELWMAMESERFFQPLLREMYREREVVTEERRMTVDNSPMGKLVEEFLSTAFKAHPYGNPLIGHLSDIRNYSREATQRFFKKYYTPSNMTIALVGDVKPETVLEMAEKYWGRIQKRPEPPRIATVEPQQQGERRVLINDKAQPAMIIGWHIPAETHDDMPALAAFADILGQGRTSRLYRRMIRDDKVSVSVSSYAGWPGSKYPSLGVIFCYPAPGKTNAECEKVIYEEIEKLQNQLLTDEDLEKVKARAMAGFIRGLNDNMGLAQQIATYQQIWGDWRQLFRELDRINKVTPQDVQRVAKQYFTASNRTVSCLETIVEQAATDKAVPSKEIKQ